MGTQPSRRGGRPPSEAPVHPLYLLSGLLAHSFLIARRLLLRQRSGGPKKGLWRVLQVPLSWGARGWRARLGQELDRRKGGNQWLGRGQQPRAYTFQVRRAALPPALALGELSWKPPGKKGRGMEEALTTDPTEGDWLLRAWYKPHGAEAGGGGGLWANFPSPPWSFCLRMLRGLCPFLSTRVLSLPPRAPARQG